MTTRTLSSQVQSPEGYAHWYPGQTLMSTPLLWYLSLGHSQLPPPPKQANAMFEELMEPPWWWGPNHQNAPGKPQNGVALTAMTLATAAKVARR